MQNSIKIKNAVLPTGGKLSVLREFLMQEGKREEARSKREFFKSILKIVKSKNNNFFFLG
ncbi:hypothetical protein NQ314_016821 [Rhamnusium bicolor]|uniref:Ribosomal protein S16 n=1 Tax=Rhamnusium bicolor TaxID=1586634 RepID=A0AAV8WVC5_9CUCU|nr:hypothetical protein NQ314_016821 [Rhamnusium bicolor]